MTAATALLLLFLVQTAPAAQLPPETEALVQQVLAASTDDARAALYRAHPELTDEAVRRAILTAANRRSTAGDTAGALNAARTLLLVANRAGNVGMRGSALAMLGTFAGQTGDLSLAETSLTEALAIAESLKEAESILTASINLAVVQRLQGRYADAVAGYQRAQQLAESSGRRDAVARILNNLGVIAQAQGDSRAALDYLTRSAAIKQELGQTRDLINTTSNIGVLHHYQRNFALARDYYERSRAAAIEIGDKRALTSALNNIGNIYANEGNFPLATARLREALAIAESGGDTLSVAHIWHNLGSIARRERRWADAAAAIARSFEIRERANDKPGMAENLVGLAEVYREQGDLRRALETSQRSVDLARSVNLLQILWGGLSIVGRVQADLGQHADAIKSLEESIEVIERIRRQVAGGTQDLQRFFEDKAEAYYDLASVYAASGRPADAFTAMERARARTLLELIAGGQRIDRTLSDAERARERELDRVILSLNERLALARRQRAAAPAIADLEAQLDAARRAREEWQFQTYDAHPELRFGRGEAPIVTLDAARAVVTPGTAVVIFLSGSERTWLVLLTPGAQGGAPAMKIFALPISRQSLSQQATAFNRQISRRDLGFAASARSLYRSLLGPADNALRAARQIVVIPDGPLWELPFQALITGRGTFVVEERAVSYAPSVSALARLQERRTARAGRAAHLVAMGDPALDAAPAALRGTDAPAGTRRFPDAAREVLEVSAMYGPGSEAFVGAEATEVRLRATASRATVLHVATHGELVASNPMYSFVTLAGGSSEADRAQDGRLEAWEIANLDLQADLVVLSACETARGADAGGEGVVGLSWSLFAAGAASASVSLWRVDSESTTRLMLAFHKALRRPAATAPSPADAMRTAARSLIASGRYRHPFYWAGFVVIGAR